MLQLIKQQEELKKKVKCYYAGLIEVYLERKEWGFFERKECIFKELMNLNNLMHIICVIDTCEGLTNLEIKFEAAMAKIDKNKCFNDDCMKQSAIEKLIEDFLADFVTSETFTTVIDGYYTKDEADDLLDEKTTVTACQGLVDISTDETDAKLEDYTLTVDIPQAVLDNETVRTATITIPSLQLLGAFTTPLEVIAAPGVDMGIQILGAIAKLEFGTSAYTTNLDIQLIQTGAGAPQATSTGILGATSDTYTLMAINDSGSLNSLINNGNLTLQVQSGNPLVGDGDLKLDITYKIVDLTIT